MGITKNEHQVRVASSDVVVTAKSGPIHATWTLIIDENEADSAAVAGDFHLRGRLADGSSIDAHVFQSLFGPTEVEILHGEEPVARFSGFVL